MKPLIALLLCLLPVGAIAQTVDEIQQALDSYDYETPIVRIAPAAGDSTLTPLRAQALKAMSRYPEALKEWNSLLKEDSTNTKVLIELAECYKLVGRGIGATACYEKAVALYPENPFFRQQHIRSLLAAENYEKVRSACHAWLDKDSLSATAFKFLGMAYEGMAMDNPDALSNAFMAYNAAYRIDSLDAQTVAHIASLFNNNEQFADAADVTERYRLTDTTSVDVNRQNAKAYCMMKEYPTAINRYEALKTMGDRSFTTLYYLGVSHYGDNWVYGARDNLLEAHKKAPNDINVLYYLAKASARSSWKDEGIAYIKKALEIAVPTDSLMARLYDGMVECYRYSKADPYEKIEAMKKLYSYNKKYTLFYTIAYTYDSQKDYANAVHYYEKYMNFVPKEKQVLLDDEGKPIANSYTLYQQAKRRVEKIKAEDFFRNGAPDDYWDPRPLKRAKARTDSVPMMKIK